MRNSRNFRSTAHSKEECIGTIFSNISVWTSILYEEDRTDDFTDEEEADDDLPPIRGDFHPADGAPSA